MKSFTFTKMNGAGNDFIVLDYMDAKKIKLKPAQIKNLCDRRRGIGADGLLLLSSSGVHDFNLEYYNSNGLLGSLCANGSRCAIKYFSDKIASNQPVVQFTCKDEIYTGEIINGNYVKFNLKSPTNLNLDLRIKYRDNDIPVYFINTGSPHAIFLWEDIKLLFTESYFEFDLIDFGRNIRNARNFKPGGTNVNVVGKMNEELFIRTYERGVENETYSCGTGSVASALVLNLLENISPPITLNTFGNDQLIVDFQVKNNQFLKISLTGPVKINYIGSCNF